MQKFRFSFLIATLLYSQQTTSEVPKCPPRIINNLCRAPLRPQNFTSTDSIAPEGYYPWHASIYHKEQPTKHVFRCAGSIISKNVILTAENCLSVGTMESWGVVYDHEIPNHQLAVQVGSITKEWGGRFFNVRSKTYVGPDDNLGLIFLSKFIPFNDVIRPVCIHINNINDVFKSQHWIPGWDKNATIGTALKHQTLLPSKENQKCFAKHYNSNTCFSEMTRKITNCMIATGTGLVYQIDGQWSIRAVASTTTYAHKNKDFTNCADSVWFTDVTKYYDWIVEAIERNSLSDEGLCHAPIMNDIKLKGTEVPIGYYPWHVSIYGDGSLGYLCGGSIISKEFVLTAAGCFFNGPTEIPSNTLYVEHGFGEKVNCYRVASKTYLTSNEDAYDKYVHNIGILRLRDSITFSESIRPICLTSIPFKHYPQTEQWVVGANENMTNLNQECVTPSSENEECMREPKYCVRVSDGVETSVAHYGSGLVFQNSRQWYLRGVAVVISAPEEGCNTTLWIIDVPSHYDWIQSQIKKIV